MLRTGALASCASKRTAISNGCLWALCPERLGSGPQLLAILQTEMRAMKFSSQPIEGATTGGPVSAAIHALDHLHEALGIPWWATIPFAAISLRTLMLPLTIKQVQSSRTTFHLLKQALETNRAQIALRNARGLQNGTKHKTSAWEVVGIFHKMRNRAGAPHPSWILLSPLIQIPVFVTSMMAVRRMGLSAWTGFSEEGILWFSDLTQPGMDFWAATAPLGPVGGVVPVAITLLYLANIELSFRTGRAPGNASKSLSASFAAILKLFLEWLSIPILVISLQLPHATLLYWLSSSLFSVAQNIGLGHPRIRAALGLAQKQALDKGHGDISNISTQKDRQKVLALFTEAATSRANGHIKQALELITNIKRIDPQNPRAHFAYAQLLQEQHQWKEASQSYERSADLEKDDQQKGRCWFCFGISQFMQGNIKQAETAILTASKLRPDDVRVWMALANIFQKLGRMNDAKGAISRAAKLDPTMYQYLLKQINAKG